MTVTKALASAGRIQAVMDMTPSTANGENTVIPEESNVGTVEFKNVSLTYAGAGAPSLSNVSFSVARGKTLGILGGTGSGKTSVINLIPRFYGATEGTVSVNGLDVKEQNAEQLRARINQKIIFVN